MAASMVLLGILRPHDDLQRIFTGELAWVRRQAECKLDLIKWDAMRYQ
jgi:hypothetical protein